MENGQDEAKGKAYPPIQISGDDLDRMMQGAQDDGGVEYLSTRGFDLPSVINKAQAFATKVFPDEESNPHRAIAAGFLVGLESGLRAVENIRNINLGP